MATSMQRFVLRISTIKAPVSRRIVCKRIGPCLQPHQLPCQHHQVSLKSTFSTSPSSAQSWQIMSAVCLERYPVISNELDEIQKRFQDMQDQQELEGSYLSEHEIQVAHEMELISKKKKGLTTEEEDIETSDTSALELEDKAKATLSSFVCAERITEADKKNDVRSLERKLDDKLILLVKHKIGDDTHWMLPQGNWEEGESLKQTAQRVLSTHCSSDNLKTQFLSSIPAGFYKFKYPKTMRQDAGKLGAKVFFIKARYLGGDFKRNDKMAEDHVWVTLEELEQYVNQSYAHKLNKFILPTTLTHIPDDWSKQVPYHAAASTA